MPRRKRTEHLQKCLPEKCRLIDSSQTPDPTRPDVPPFLGPGELSASSALGATAAARGFLASGGGAGWRLGAMLGLGLGLCRGRESGRARESVQRGRSRSDAPAQVTAL